MAEEDLLICRCEEVSLAEIVEAIHDGASTLDEVKRRTRAGMGLCQGKTCTRLVTQILARQTGQPVGEVLPSTSRPPVRPIALGILSSVEGENDVP